MQTQTCKIVPLSGKIHTEGFLNKKHWGRKEFKEFKAAIVILNVEYRRGATVQTTYGMNLAATFKEGKGRMVQVPGSDLQVRSVITVQTPTQSTVNRSLLTQPLWVAWVNSSPVCVIDSLGGREKWVGGRSLNFDPKLPISHTAGRQFVHAASVDSIYTFHYFTPPKGAVSQDFGAGKTIIILLWFLLQLFYSLLSQTDHSGISKFHIFRGHCYFRAKDNKLMTKFSLSWSSPSAGYIPFCEYGCHLTIVSQLWKIWFYFCWSVKQVLVHDAHTKSRIVGMLVQDVQEKAVLSL